MGAGGAPAQTRGSRTCRTSPTHNGTRTHLRTGSRKTHGARPCRPARQRPTLAVTVRLRLIKEAINALLPVAQVGGDVIRAVNGEEVKDLEAFVKLYDEAVKKKETRVLLEVQRGRGRQAAVMKVSF